MKENHQNETESKQIATAKTLPLPPSSPEGPEKLDSLHDNRLEDTIKYLRDRGYKVTEEYSGDTPGQLSKVSKVSLERPPRKTLWDWLQLLIIPLLIVAVGSGFTWVQKQTSQKIADDQQQETILQTYLDNMSDLLLTQHLSTSKPGEAVREVAKERTLTTLRRLHTDRNKIVLRFLQEAHLVGIQDAVINLSNADLSNDDLSGIDLSGIDLSGGNFNDSHLHGTDLYGSNLIGATLGRADLSSADLSEALLSRASLNSAHLNSAHLSNADLSGADLSNADLSEAFLSDTILSNADLSNATLNGAHLNHADLSNATLSGADLSNATLSNATLNGANNLTQQQLDTVSSCTNANSLPTGLTCNHSGSMVTLTYWYTESPAETPVIRRLIDQFQQQYPNIKINAVSKPFLQTQSAFITAAQAGNAPDVLRSAVDWVTPLASQHYLLNIDSYISQSALSDYLSAPLSYDKYNGHLYGLPQVTDCLALLYNQAELAKAGITSPPATMHNFEIDAIKIVHSNPATYGFETTGRSYEVLPFLWAFGGGMIDEHNNILVSNDGSVAGLNFLLNLQNKDKVMPPKVDFSNGVTNMVSDFMSGKTAMIFDGPWDVSKILTGSAFKGNPSNLGIAAVPMDLSGDQPRSPAGGQSYAISADTAHPAEAYKFISFMSSTTSQVAIAQANSTLPTRKSAKSAYQDLSVSGNARIIKAFYDILPTAHARPAIPQGGYLLDAFDPNIRAALDGTKSAPDALTAVADAWKQLLGS